MSAEVVWTCRKNGDRVHDSCVQGRGDRGRPARDMQDGVKEALTNRWLTFELTRVTFSLESWLRCSIMG